MTDHMRIQDMPRQERPRERLAAQGVQALSTHELLAIILRTGTKGQSALHLAEQLLKHFRSMTRLAEATVDELQQVKGVGPDKAVTLIAAFKLARKIAEELRQELPTLDNSANIVSQVRDELRDGTVEKFVVLLLNTRRKLIRMETISQGTLDSALVHPREVFKPAISANASAVVLVHNHPSGDPSPSDADIKITRDLIRAGQLLKIEVLDHVILGRAVVAGGNDYVSLSELGYCYG